MHQILNEFGGRQNITERPELLKPFLKKLSTDIEIYKEHESELTEILDGIFGLPGNVWESHSAAKRRYPEHRHESIRHAPTHYSKIQMMLNILRPDKNDVFYDLGSGYGRVVLYTALMTRAQCFGVELIEDRLQKGREAARKLKLKNAEFLSGNVLDQNLNIANIFFLFNPFKGSVLTKVVEKLKDISDEKKITVIIWGGREMFFTNRNWLEVRTKIPIKHGPMYIMDSI
ncbi:MAG: methyltransferase domain-containing protein [Candidatus Spechtbacterales bacterium]|nr:methyltransferase domain-containing protein [Candidatus Spechtbacterales bacterium]